MESSLISVWAADEGLPASSVTALAQTPDGYLWVGTYGGLARFDGVRFTAFFPASTPALTHPRIQALAVDVAGTLWITTYDNTVVSYRNDQFKLEWRGRTEGNVPLTLVTATSNSWLFTSTSGEVLQGERSGGSTNIVWTDLTPGGGQRFIFQCQDGRGESWFLSRESRAVRLVGGKFVESPAGSAPPAATLLTLAADVSGGIWAGTTQGIWRWDGEKFLEASATNAPTPYEAQFVWPTRSGALWVWGDGRLRKQEGRQWVAEIAECRGLLGYAGGHYTLMNEDRNGGVWFGHYGNGLFHVTADGEAQRFSSANGLPGDRIWSWLQMRDGTVWVGVDRGGLVRIRPRPFQVTGLADGLAAGAVLSVCEDATGARWFGTSGGGLAREVDGRVENFPVSPDAVENFVFSVFPQAGPGLWLSASSREDLFQFRDGKIQNGPWLVHGIKCLLVDRSGRLWMGTKSGLNWWTPQVRRSLTLRQGLVGAPVRALAEDEAGQVWGGTEDGTLYRCEPDKVEAFRAAGPLAGAPISALRPDRDGVIWIGTFGGGLLRFKDGKFARVKADDGLASDMITQLLDDGAGWIWMGTQHGISRVTKVALNAFLAGDIARAECINYGVYDGLPTTECAANYQPSAWRGADGRLWFATTKGVVSVQPAAVRRNVVPPDVLVEEVRVDGESFATTAASVVVPPGRRRLDFHYTAFSFQSPDAIRFRCRLAGGEDDWVEVGTTRVATYSLLPPGEFEFQVLACNSDGVWSDAPASVRVRILPRFYQTGWFVTLVVLGTLGGMGLAVRQHTARKYRMALQKLEQQHAIEQDRARIAKDIHDDLGAGLTQITLLSELARHEPPEQVEGTIHRISESARQLTRAMDEIVWAVDPQHDTLAGFIDYASVYAEDFLRTAGVSCRMDVPMELPAITVDAEVRYHLFLALKETLNNVVKHAAATKVRLVLRLEPGRITLIVEDNGRGLASGPSGVGGPRLASGHGLGNLEQRLNSIGGSCVMRSDPEQGTRVELSARVPGLTTPILGAGQNPPQ
jgi:signal transduction histidine kinase/ligand-binding sensor domain-containing protein